MWVLVNIFQLINHFQLNIYIFKQRKFQMQEN